jgi:hypothetical protein
MRNKLFQVRKGCFLRGCFEDLKRGKPWSRVKTRYRDLYVTLASCAWSANRKLQSKADQSTPGVPRFQALSASTVVNSPQWRRSLVERFF